MVSFARVGDLAEQIRGVTYGKEDASKTPTPGYLPVLRAGNITDGGLVFDDLVYVPEARVAAKQKIKKGDIVIAASSGSLDVVGKAAPALAAFDGGFGAFCKVIRPNNKVDAGYLAQFFKTPSYRRTISSLAAGANINNLKSEHLDDLRVPLPPLPEQRRIAAILDQADALRAKRREALAQLDSLTQSIFIEMFGDEATNFKALPKRPLGDVIQVKSGDFLPAAAMSPEGKVPVFGGNGVNGFHNIAMFRQPRIVIGRVGAYCGCVHTTPSECWVTDNAMYVSRIDDSLLFEYLAFALQRANLNRVASQSGQPLVSASRIYPVEILVPPIGDQQSFATRIQAVDSLKTTHRASLAESDALFASLQHRAFAGQLS